MLCCVDEVIIFDDPTPSNLIALVKPDIIVKGNEWPVEELRVKDNVPSHIEIRLAPLSFNPEHPTKKYSTTDIIKKIRGDGK